MWYHRKVKEDQPLKSPSKDPLLPVSPGRPLRYKLLSQGNYRYLRTSRASSYFNALDLQPPTDDGYHRLPPSRERKVQLNSLFVHLQGEAEMASEGSQASPSSLSSSESFEENSDEDSNSMTTNDSEEDNEADTDEGMSEDSFEVLRGQ